MTWKLIDYRQKIILAPNILVFVLLLKNVSIVSFRAINKRNFIFQYIAKHFHKPEIICIQTLFLNLFFSGLLVI